MAPLHSSMKSVDKTDESKIIHSVHTLLRHGHVNGRKN